MRKTKNGMERFFSVGTKSKTEPKIISLYFRSVHVRINMLTSRQLKKIKNLIRLTELKTEKNIFPKQKPEPNPYTLL